MNERLQILNLLEQGKINSDEAARLLEALAQSKDPGTRKKFRLWRSLEGLPEIISTAIETSSIHRHTEEKLQFPQKANIEFKGISGDIDILGESRDNIEIHKDGFGRTKEKDNILMIKALSGDIEIRTNHKTNLVIKGISGDIGIDSLCGKIDIESVSGDIVGKNLAGSLCVKIVSGDMDLEYKDIDELNIESRSGDITLRLEKNVETTLNIETEDGDIDCDFTLKDEEKSTHFLKGVINNPKAKINIVNRSGDVSIRKQKE